MSRRFGLAAHQMQFGKTRVRSVLCALRMSCTLKTISECFHIFIERRSTEARGQFSLRVSVNIGRSAMNVNAM